MSLVMYDPFAAFFDGFLAPQRGAPTFRPAADLTVSDNDLVLTVDLPGLTADDVELHVDDGFLVLCGERARPQPGADTTWAHVERGFGRFERRLRLPDGVDPDAITATMDHGVLSLIVPKPERLRRRAIAIGNGREQAQLEPVTT